MIELNRLEFRGKTKYNSRHNWIYGTLLNLSAYSYIILPYKSEFEDLTDFKYLEVHMVINETAGQCTRKRDKNGKWIFDGDILKADVKGVKYIGRVAFEHGSWIFNPHGDLDYCPLFDFMDINLEVIGNIHDNPELLGR